MAGFSLDTPLGGELGEAEAQPLRVTLTLFLAQRDQPAVNVDDHPKVQLLDYPILAPVLRFMALSFTWTLSSFSARPWNTSRILRSLSVINLWLRTIC